MEIGSLSTVIDFDATAIEGSVQMALTEAIKDGMLDDVSVDPDSGQVLHVVLGN